MQIGNSKYELNNIYNEDCLQAMKQIPDKYFDLCIVDPPYGIDVANDSRFGKTFNNAATTRKEYKKLDWDKQEPNEDYFKELFRVSKNQIIFGVNYYSYNLKGGRIFWDKDVADGYSASRGELAYKSMGYGIDYVKITWSGMRQENMKNKEERIHPTQKPVALYEWLLKNYAKKGDKILDTHLGSASSIIACKKLGFDYLGFELDEEYFKSASERISKFEAQGNLFDILNEQKQEIEQENLFKGEII